MTVFFSGIGGVGIGPLAMLALDCGYGVSGSDLQTSEMVSFLRHRGATVYIGQDGSEIAREHKERSIDWFVYSSALPSDHPEINFARQHGIKTSKRDEFLNEVLKQKKLRLIAVSGTHGKTTTTGMLIWIFQQLGIPISYSIGTSISFGPAAQYQAKSQYFIYECDEFDRNFLSFHPSFSLIPSLDYDHPDTYPTKEEYNLAFSNFISQSSQTYLWQSVADQLNIRNAQNITILDQSDLGQDLITLPGEHMRRNAWLAVKALSHILDVPISDMAPPINSFPGTNRRFEKITENLYTDYAHHPVEIAATIQMAQEINPNVVVVYQPHQNIRQHEIMKEGGYKSCFTGAKKIYWLPTYLSREYQDLGTLSPKELINSTTSKDIIESADLNDDLAQKIKAHQQAGDLVLAMSAGDLDHWLRQNL